MSDADNPDSHDGSSVEDSVLGIGLLDIRLERLVKKVMGTPLQQELLPKIGTKVPKGTSLKETMRVVMDKVYKMDIGAKTELLKSAMYLKLRAACENSVWHTLALSGEELVTSPRGRRKIALRIQHQLHNTVEATVERADQAVWVVLFSRYQLQRLENAHRMPAVSTTAFVWYPGEDALYCNRARCTDRVLLAVCTTLGYGAARPIRLSGRRLSSLRLMFNAKSSHKFYDTSIPEDQYPLPF